MVDAMLAHFFDTVGEYHARFKIVNSTFKKKVKELSERRTKQDPHCPRFARPRLFRRFFRAFSGFFSAGMFERDARQPFGVSDLFVSARCARRARESRPLEFEPHPRVGLDGSLRGL